MSIPRYLRPVFIAATHVEPDPINGSKIISSLNEYNSINLLGNSTGKGAGCPILYADTVGNLHIDLVYSINSLFSIVSILPFSFSSFERGSL